MCLCGWDVFAPSIVLLFLFSDYRLLTLNLAEASCEIPRSPSGIDESEHSSTFCINVAIDIVVVYTQLRRMISL